jgi:hypothetical protein
MQEKPKRPDTPLAATPEPMPVSSGLQPMPVTKFQATADAAIKQINEMSAAKQQPQQAQQPQQTIKQQ